MQETSLYEHMHMTHTFFGWYVPLADSTLPHVAQFGADGTSNVASSAVHLYKSSVDKYLGMLSQAHPYCITTASANRAKVPDFFERDYVLDQLHFTGTSTCMNFEAVFRG